MAQSASRMLPEPHGLPGPMGDGRGGQRKTPPHRPLLLVHTHLFASLLICSELNTLGQTCSHSFGFNYNIKKREIKIFQNIIIDYIII